MNIAIVSVTHLAPQLDSLVEALLATGEGSGDEGFAAWARGLLESLRRAPVEQDSSADDAGGWIAVRSGEGADETIDAWRTAGTPATLTASVTGAPALTLEAGERVWILEAADGGTARLRSSATLAGEVGPPSRQEFQDAYERWQEQHADPQVWRCDRCGLINRTGGSVCTHCSTARADASPFLPGRAYEVPSELTGSLATEEPPAEFERLFRTALSDVRLPEYLTELAAGLSGKTAGPAIS